VNVAAFLDDAFMPVELSREAHVNDAATTLLMFTHGEIAGSSSGKPPGSCRPRRRLRDPDPDALCAAPERDLLESPGASR
jgi:hypothetical protein